MNKQILLKLFFCFFTSAVFTVKASEVSASAHLASPDIYSVLLENDQVLVLKMTLQPGTSDNWHKHNAETVYFESGGKATITSQKGSHTMDIPDGYTMWHNAWAHQVSNVGDTTITAIIVERK